MQNLDQTLLKIIFIKLKIKKKTKLNKTLKNKKYTIHNFQNIISEVNKN